MNCHGTCRPSHSCITAQRTAERPPLQAQFCDKKCAQHCCSAVYWGRTVFKGIYFLQCEGFRYVIYIMSITGFCDMTLCRLLGRYQHFGESCYLRLQGISSLNMVPGWHITWCHIQEDCSLHIHRCGHLKFLYEISRRYASTVRPWLHWHSTQCKLALHYPVPVLCSFVLFRGFIHISVYTDSDLCLYSQCAFKQCQDIELFLQLF